MTITKISDQHLINRIKYFERMLDEKPSEQTYMGESFYAEQAVESENTHNELEAEKIKNHIKYMRSELNQRTRG